MSTIEQVDRNEGREKSMKQDECITQLDLKRQYMTACISPNYPRMIEPYYNTVTSDERERTVVGEKLTVNNEKEPSVPESYLSSNEVLQSPFELENRSKRQKLSFEQTRFSDIIGHASVKLRIDELILPLGLPSTIAASVLRGIRSIPSSILLYGPPGCGKTKLARAIAGEARSAFISVAPSDILSKYVGESEASIRSIFQKAVIEALNFQSKCAVIFFDEIDALGQSRENSGSGEGDGCSRRVLSELLLLLNVIADNRNCTIENFRSNLDHPRSNIDNNDNPSSHCPEILEGQCAHIIVVAATNRIEDCDSALLRRFGIQLEVSLPSLKDRERMLLRHLNGIDHILKKNDMQNLAIMTEQWSGSALENLAREACMRPIRECLHRAAVIRRRTEIREQQGGDASGQWDDPESPDVVANKCLLEDFQRLRQVTIGDFRSAISTLTGVSVSVMVQAPFVTEQKPKKVEEHYDSSSEEENL